MSSVRQCLFCSHAIGHLDLRARYCGPRCKTRAKQALARKRYGSATAAGLSAATAKALASRTLPIVPLTPTQLSLFQ
jgi:hypothetical protein